MDLETLFSYLHLVISGYNECICCGTQRHTALAVQQRELAPTLLLLTMRRPVIECLCLCPADMLDKGHCRFDIDRDDSEYAISTTSPDRRQKAEEEDADDTSAHAKARMENLTARSDENSLRLPSGRIISNRSQPQTNPRRQPLGNHALLASRAAAKGGVHQWPGHTGGRPTQHH